LNFLASAKNLDEDSTAAAVGVIWSIAEETPTSALEISLVATRVRNFGNAMMILCDYANRIR